MRTKTDAVVKIVVVCGIMAVAAVILVSSSAAGRSGSSASARKATSTGYISAAQVLDVAQAAAAQAGDPSPSSIEQSALTTRAEANSVASGEIVPGTNGSYLIAERGQFKATNAPIPSGAPIPQGSVLTLVVDATTGEVTDSGISDNYPDMSSLGGVTDLVAAQKAP